MNLGETLKNERNKKQLTQEQLAEKLFVSTKTISNWETGKTTPDIDSLIRLANLFNLSLDNILLEGSDIVENIKKQTEIKTTRVYQIFSFITNLVFLFILTMQPVFGNLPLPFLIALVISIMSNGFVVLYFSYKLNSLQGHTKWSDYSKKEQSLRIIISSLFVIVVLSALFYFRFYY